MKRFLIIFILLVVAGCSDNSGGYYADSDTGDGGCDSGSNDDACDTWGDSGENASDNDTDGGGMRSTDSSADTASDAGDGGTGGTDTEWGEDTSTDTDTGTMGDTGEDTDSQEDTATSPQDTEVDTSADTGTGEPIDTDTGYECPNANSYTTYKKGDRVYLGSFDRYYLCVASECKATLFDSKWVIIPSCDYEDGADTEDTDTEDTETVDSETVDTDTEITCLSGGYAWSQTGYDSCYYIGESGWSCKKTCTHHASQVYDEGGIATLNKTNVRDMLFGMGEIHIIDIEIRDVSTGIGSGVWGHTGFSVDYPWMYWDGFPNESASSPGRKRVCSCKESI